MSESQREDAIPLVLPRGRSAVSRSTVRTSQHKRLIDAMIVLAAERGYPNVTIAGLVAEAGVAKPTFYEHFIDKEACFIATYERIAEASGAAVAAALSPDAPVEVRVSAGVKALLEFFAEDDARARVLLIESLKAGPNVAATVTETHTRMAALYVHWREESRIKQPELAPITVTRGLAIVGAISEPVIVVLRDNPASKILELVDELNTVVQALAFA